MSSTNQGENRGKYVDILITPSLDSHNICANILSRKIKEMIDLKRNNIRRGCLKIMKIDLLRMTEFRIACNSFTQHHLMNNTARSFNRVFGCVPKPVEMLRVGKFETLGGIHQKDSQYNKKAYHGEV